LDQRSCILLPSIMTSSIFKQALQPRERMVLIQLVVLWLLGTLAFWRWAFQPAAWTTFWGTALNALLLIYATGLSLWPFSLFLRMQQVDPNVPLPTQLRVAMVVTKAPSEPWPLVRATLAAMLAQEPVHDTWLADEQPSAECREWCEQHGVWLSSRFGVEAYQRQSWPRRRGCKEGNLAYFYDHYGYERYDVVVQLDADHVPEPGYLAEMLRPFTDPSIGYVAAPSICHSNAANSWAARGRLYAESVLHGPLQMGLNGGWAPLCIGSHYAVRTSALEEIGGLGPELAEDHSTTLLMNAKGWSGAFAHRALASGLGPESFEDAMVQEFQWSKSLTMILFRLTPRCLSTLPWHLCAQFLYSQIFYLLLGVTSFLLIAWPLAALFFNRAWMNVHYPSFLLLSSLQVVLTILPVLFLRRLGLLRPMDSPVLSWELMLFQLSRGPWVLAGVVSGLRACLGHSPKPFRVTRKLGDAGVMPRSYLLPYLLFSLLGVIGVVLFANQAWHARGYVLLSLISTLMISVTALAIVFLNHRASHLSLRVYLPHYALTGGAVIATFWAGWIRQQDLLIPFLAPIQLSSADLLTFVIS
jgi:cellulose synthase (UDP-forming)